MKASEHNALQLQLYKQHKLSCGLLITGEHADDCSPFCFISTLENLGHI